MDREVYFNLNDFDEEGYKKRNIPEAVVTQLTDSFLKDSYN